MPKISIMTWNLWNCGYRRFFNTDTSNYPSTEFSNYLAKLIINNGISVAGLLEFSISSEEQANIIGTKIIQSLNVEIGKDAFHGPWDFRLSAAQDGKRQGERVIVLWDNDVIQLDEDCIPGPTFSLNVVNEEAFDFMYNQYPNLYNQAYYKQLVAYLKLLGYVKSNKTSSPIRRVTGLGYTAALKKTPFNRLPPLGTVSDTVLGPQILSAIGAIDFLYFPFVGERPPFIGNFTFGGSPLTYCAFHAPGPLGSAPQESINPIGLSSFLQNRGNLVLAGDFNVPVDENNVTHSTWGREASGNGYAWVRNPADENKIPFWNIANLPNAPNNAAPLLGMTYQNVTERDGTTSNGNFTLTSLRSEIREVNGKTTNMRSEAYDKIFTKFSTAPATLKFDSAYVADIVADMYSGTGMSDKNRALANMAITYTGKSFPAKVTRPTKITYNTCADYVQKKITDCNDRINNNKILISKIQVGQKSISTNASNMAASNPNVPKPKSNRPIQKQSVSVAGKRSSSLKMDELALIRENAKYNDMISIYRQFLTDVGQTVPALSNTGSSFIVTRMGITDHLPVIVTVATT